MASYEGAMEAAGATVHVFEQFGSYQGDWFAQVTYNGVTGWVNGSYGSCSGCDALQAEFDYSDEPEDTFEEWVKSWRRDGGGGTREEWEAARAAFQAKYADFGRGYLDDILTQEQAEERASRNLSWDSDAQEMLDFLKRHRPQASKPEPPPIPPADTTVALGRFDGLDEEDI